MLPIYNMIILNFLSILFSLVLLHLQPIHFTMPEINKCLFYLEFQGNPTRLNNKFHLVSSALGEPPVRPPLVRLENVRFGYFILWGVARGGEAPHVRLQNVRLV